MTDLESLFQPITIGDMVVKNRLVMAPMGTGFGVEDGSMTERLIDYYAERARGGVGLIIVEAACVDAPVGKGIFTDLGVDSDRYIPGLARLVDAVHAGGARVCLQLNHAGRYARSSWTGVQPVAPSAVRSRYTGEMPRELDTSEVEGIIEKFARAAGRAREAGFDGVELLASTGYLMSEFLSPLTNKRTDRFGGDLEGRCTFAVGIIKAVCGEVGGGFPVSCRHSLAESLPGGNTTEESMAIARRMEEAGVSMLHAYPGWHESPVALLPMSVERGAFVHLAQSLKEVVGVPVITVGRINDPALAGRIIRDGKADLVAMGRAFLADPHLARKAESGALDDIRMCIGCCRCIDEMMLGMQNANRETSVICSVNAELGREGEGCIRQAPRARKVLVVGGGPAGMEAAWVAALRGHDVTLWERSDRLGGNLVPGSASASKAEVKNLVSYLSHQMQKQGVRVELNRNADVESVRRHGADAVVLGLGASPLVPKMKGLEGDRVVSAVDVLSGKGETGKDVVVVGGGMVGCEAAEFLASRGKRVTVVEMLERIAQDMGPTTRWVALRHLRELGVELLVSTRVVAVTERGVVVEKNGETSTVGADSVVLAVGLTPNRELAESLANTVPELHVVGDCREVNKILEAVHEGWEVGRAL